jgi:hypothetical protein
MSCEHSFMFTGGNTLARDAGSEVEFECMCGEKLCLEIPGYELMRVDMGSKLAEGLELALSCGLPPTDVSGSRMWADARQIFKDYRTPDKHSVKQEGK